MSYIDAFKRGENICVSVRDEAGVRHERYIPASYYFYYEDDDGKYRSMFGHKLERIDFKTYNKMKFTAIDIQDSGIETFESDVKPEYRVLEDYFVNSDLPNVNVAVLDIESDRDKTKPYSNVVDPYAIINAITIDQKWLGVTTTLAVCPPTMTMEEAEAAVVDIENSFVVETEEELLLATLALLDDADIITGWNSQFYDLPMIIQRIRITLGNENIDDVGNLDDYHPSGESRSYLKHLCLFDEIPTPAKVDRGYGSEEWTFRLKGKVHLDYLDLYKKFTFVELHSYKLDYILELEINENKIEYTGSLDDLWRDDFKLFVEYNRQDTIGLSKVDDSRKFIDLANSMCHTACVLFKDTLGSVTIIEHAIMVELHKKNRIAPDKKPSEKDGKVAGAFVVLPDGGLYDWVCSFDINSLYPSVIRMLNISPETVIGQIDNSGTIKKIRNMVETKKVKTETEGWHFFTGVEEYHSIQEGSEENQTLIFEDRTRKTLSSKDWKEWLENNDICITANGTVFSTDEQGIIPFCLEKWYNERVEFKQKSKDAYNDGDGDLSSYWDTIQQARKLFLNSTYGALLNEFFRFYDPRFGQSVTLSGRVVTKHMIRKACEVIDGEYTFGPASVYGDTDSCYASIASLITDPEDIDTIVELADAIGAVINDSFPGHMMEQFFVPHENGAVIQAGREVVARRGIFKDQTKKRYALYVIDEEGKRKDKLKIMGMETQRSDTPKWIQTFLHDCLELVVMDGKGERALRDLITKFRDDVFLKKENWELGNPKTVKNLKTTMRLVDMYNDNRLAEKPDVYYVVQAASNYNKYLKYFDDLVMNPIIDGDKVEIMYLNEKDLKNNPLCVRNIAVPVGMRDKSEWLRELPIDTARAYEGLVRKKVDNIFGVFDWNLEPPVTTAEEVFEW